MSFCSSSANEDQQLRSARTFVEEYDRWAQDGFSEELPESLRSMAAGKALVSIESDARWYSRGRVKQAGTMKITDMVILESSADQAVVEAHLDSSEISVTADGQPTWRSSETRQVLILALQKLDSWKVVDATALENPLSE